MRLLRRQMTEVESRNLSSKAYVIDENFRDLIYRELSSLYKDNSSLQQLLRKQHNDTEATKESFLLELLEISDALEALLNHLETSSELNPTFLKRLPKLLGASYRKFMDALERQGVSQISLTDSQFDNLVCKGVDCEVRPDLPELTVIKVLKRGFKYSDKVLRPAEVITSTQYTSASLTTNAIDNSAF